MSTNPIFNDTWSIWYGSMCLDDLNQTIPERPDLTSLNEVIALRYLGVYPLANICYTY